MCVCVYVCVCLCIVMNNFGRRRKYIRPDFNSGNGSLPIDDIRIEMMPGKLVIGQNSGNEGRVKKFSRLYKFWRFEKGSVYNIA